MRFWRNIKLIRVVRGIAVGIGVKLRNPSVRWHEARDERALKGTRGGNHIGGVDHARRCFGTETGAVGFPIESLDLDAAADGGRDLFGISHEILDDLAGGSEAVGIDVGERPTRKSIMPSRTVGNE